MKNFKLDKNNILILIIGLLSLGNIFLQFIFHNYPSIIVSVIGIAGVILFFLKRNSFRYFIWIWIFAQVLIINHAVLDQTSNLLINRPVFDFSQVFNMKFGFQMSNGLNVYSLNFNILTIAYFFLFRNLKTTALVGKSIDLLIMKGNNDIVFNEGTYATLMQRVNLDGADDWLLGQLSSSLSYNGNTIDQILTQTIDGDFTGVFRIVQRGQVISEKVNKSADFERVEWIVIG